MSGLLESFSAAMAGGARSMVDDLEGQIADTRAKALYEAKQQIDQTFDVAREGRESEQRRGDATWAADEAIRRDDEKKSKLSGLLESARHPAGDAGGYDPKGYDNLDTAGKAEFDLNTLGNAGELPTGKLQEFQLGRHDKAASLESKNALAEMKLDLMKQVAEGKLSLMEAQAKLAESRAAAAEAKAATGGTTTDFQITRNDFIAAYKDDRTMVTDKGGLTSKGLTALKRLSKDEPTDTITDSVDKVDEYGVKTGSTSTSRKVPRGSTPARGANDPLGLRK